MGGGGGGGGSMQGLEVVNVYLKDCTVHMIFSAEENFTYT